MESFSGDVAAPAHPRVMEAVIEANAGPAPGYGADRWSQAARELLEREFGPVTSLLVFGGTGANVLALRALCMPGESVICPAVGHINTHEAGAAESVAGLKLLSVHAPDGKLRVPQLEELVDEHQGPHRAPPGAISITQASECGTIYSPEELAELSAFARAHGLRLHIDGARLANAAAALDVPLRALTSDIGADVFSVGLTKSGALGAEAVVATGSAGGALERLSKQTLQMPAKSRYLAAQLLALLKDELWRENAAQANLMARYLGELLAAVPPLEVTRSIDTNAVFVRAPAGLFDAIVTELDAPVWSRRDRELRCICSWATTTEEVERFAASVGALCADYPHRRTVVAEATPGPAGTRV